MWIEVRPEYSLTQLWDGVITCFLLEKMYYFWITMPELHSCGLEKYVEKCLENFDYTPVDENIFMETFIQLVRERNNE